MSDRVKIYIEKSKQCATAIIEFHDFPICGKHHRSVLLKDIKDLKAFNMPTSVKLLDIEADFYIQNLDTLICYDTAVFDCLFNKLNKESKVNPMTHTVTIKKTEKRVIEEYWLMRGIKKDFQADCMISCSGIFMGKGDKILEEKESKTEPTLEQIAQFLSDSNADFVSVEHNYRFEPDLPFC